MEFNSIPYPTNQTHQRFQILPRNPNPSKTCRQTKRALIVLMFIPVLEVTTQFRW